MLLCGFSFLKFAEKIDAICILHEDEQQGDS